MGVIQSSINQMIGTVGIMGGLYANSPAGKERTELSSIASKLDKSKLKAEEITEAFPAAFKEKGLSKEDTEAALDKQFDALHEEELGLVQRQFELSPSRETAKEYAGTLSSMAAKEALKSVREAQSMKRMQQEAIRKQILGENNGRNI